MLNYGFFSLDTWVNTLKNGDILAILIGCYQEGLPPFGSYYDFIARLWLLHKDLDKTERKHLNHFPQIRNLQKIRQGKKLANRHPEIVKKTISFVLKQTDFPFYCAKLLQEIFSLIAVVPSIELGLVSIENFTAAGDGTCVHSDCDALGNKVCDCNSKGVYDCKCDRKFSVPDTSYGWDSDLAVWYF